MRSLPRTYRSLNCGLLVVLMLFAGCRDSQPTLTEDGRKIVRFFILLISTKQVEYFQWAEQAFEAEYPDVDLRIEQFPGSSLKDFEVKLRLRFASGTPPDVFGTTESVFAELARLGLLAPAPQHIVDLNNQSINEMARRAPFLEGTSYGLTSDAVWTALYYNKQMFREAGLDPENPPKTWDELIDYAEKLTLYNPDGTLKRAGISLRKTGFKPGTAEKWLTFLYSAGGQPFNDEGTRATFNTEAGRTALQLYKTILFDKRLDSVDLEGDQQGFGQGRSAMFIREAHVIRWLQRNYPDLEFGVTPIPALKASVSNGGSYLYVVGVDSPNQEAAWQWVSFLRTPEVYQKYLDIGGVMPSIQWAAENYRDDPHLSVFLDQAVAPTPNIPKVARALEILGTYIEQFCYGKISMDDMLTRAERDVTAIIMRNK